MNAPRAAPQPVAKRRWLPIRFGLRSLLVAITCIAIACAILASRIREGYRHRALATRLGVLSVSWTHYKCGPDPNNPGRECEQSTLPAWVEASPLSLAFRRIGRVILEGPPYDKELSVLAELGEVQDVSVYGTDFGEQDLERLLSHVSVESLYIESAQLSEGRLPCLSLQRLKWLCVGRTRFSNPAIDDLPPSLSYLDARRTRISDQGLPKLTRLKRLRTLDLSRTPTTAAAVQRLREQMPLCKIFWEPLLLAPQTDP